MKISDAQFATSAFAESGYPPEEPPEIAFAGRSNVGKSSLMNALLGRKKLVKTSSTPGKTQSINFFLINDAFHFVDLPGYGYAKVPKKIQAQWGPMMDTYFRTRKTLRAVVCLIDCRREIRDLDLDLFGYLEKYKVHRILVFTKFDKLKKSQQNAFPSMVERTYGLPEAAYFRISSQTRFGVEILWREIEIYLSDLASVD